MSQYDPYRVLDSTTKTKVIKTSPFYESKNEIEAMLRNGNEEQRIWAICSLDHKEENYDLVWEIFLSDIDFQVRGNALCAACHIKPKKMWYMLKYVLKNDTKDNAFTRIIAQHLLEQHEKE